MLNFKLLQKRANELGKNIEDLDIIFTSTCGELNHIGHIDLYYTARSLGDYLVVGLINDPTVDRPDTKNKPVQSLFERWGQLNSVEYIDEVIPLDSEKDLENCLLTLLPKIRLVGEEYRDKDFTGKYIKEIEVKYNKRRHSYSSSDLRKRCQIKENGKASS